MSRVMRKFCKSLVGIYYRGRLNRRLPRKFCVSIFRQNQEYHIIDVHDWGLFPLAFAFPGGWDGMRAGRRECRPNLPGILMQGDQPTFRSVNMIAN